MKTIAIIEVGKDGRFGVFTPNLESTIIGDGKTVAEAKSDFENSVREMILSYTENGEKLPEELKDLEFEYKYDVASFLEYFKILNISQFAKSLKINPSLMRQYKAGQYISNKQKMKIQDAVQSIGRELSHIQFV